MPQGSSCTGMRQTCPAASVVGCKSSLYVTALQQLLHRIVKFNNQEGAVPFAGGATRGQRTHSLFEGPEDDNSSVLQQQEYPHFVVSPTQGKGRARHAHASQWVELLCAAISDVLTRGTCVALAHSAVGDTTDTTQCLFRLQLPLSLHNFQNPFARQGCTDPFTASRALSIRFWNSCRCSALKSNSRFHMSGRSADTFSGHFSMCGRYVSSSASHLPSQT